MASESERLIRLISELLRLARADARQSLPAEVVPIEPLIDDVCRQARRLEPERSIRGTSPPAVSVLANRDGLKQVLLALVDNALSHTLGPIEVSADVVGNTVRLGIRDSGPGIAADELPHVFERFYRGRKSVTSARAGLGLGLPIAKSLVEAQGGIITVDSDESRGSDFTVALPRAAGVPPV
jgi:signal transduction histidine kinase